MRAEPKNRDAWHAAPTGECGVIQSLGDCDRLDGCGGMWCGWVPPEWKYGEHKEWCAESEARGGVTCPSS
jgi:hypothetical protein